MTFVFIITCHNNHYDNGGMGNGEVEEENVKELEILKTHVTFNQEQDLSLGFVSFFSLNFEIERCPICTKFFSQPVKLLFINSFLGRLIYIFLELSVLFIASVSMLFILVLVVFLISVCHWDVNEIIDTLLNRNQYHQFWCWWFCLYPADIVKSQAEAILGLFPFFLHIFFFKEGGVGCAGIESNGS